MIASAFCWLPDKMGEKSDMVDLIRYTVSGETSRGG